MAKYLWWRGSSGWTFQIGIPKSFVNRYGATPFRIALGSLSTIEARRRSRILAGYVTATFGDTMSREAVARGLTENASQLDKLSKQETSVKFAILRATGALYEMEEGSFGHLAEPSPAHHEQALAVARAERAVTPFIHPAEARARVEIGAGAPVEQRTIGGAGRGCAADRPLR